MNICSLQIIQAECKSIWLKVEWCQNLPLKGGHPDILVNLLLCLGIHVHTRVCTHKLCVILQTAAMPYMLLFHGEHTEDVYSISVALESWFYYLVSFGSQ